MLWEEESEPLAAEGAGRRSVQQASAPHQPEGPGSGHPPLAHAALSLELWAERARHLESGRLGSTLALLPQDAPLGQVTVSFALQSPPLLHEEEPHWPESAPGPQGLWQT